MSRSDENGADVLAVAAAVLIYVVGSLAIQHWYITIPVAIVLFFVIRHMVLARAKKRREHLARVRAQMAVVGAEMVTLHGADYAALFADALDLLASGEAPTFAGFQRQLGIPRRWAGDLMVDLERQGVVAPSVNGRRRSTTARPDELSAAAAGVRIAVVGDG